MSPSGWAEETNAHSAGVPAGRRLQEVRPYPRNAEKTTADLLRLLRLFVVGDKLPFSSSVSVAVMIAARLRAALAATVNVFYLGFFIHHSCLVWPVDELVVKGRLIGQRFVDPNGTSTLDGHIGSACWSLWASSNLLSSATLSPCAAQIAFLERVLCEVEQTDFSGLALRHFPTTRQYRLIMAFAPNKRIARARRNLPAQMW